MINFDNAATTGKKPETVINAVNNALRRFSANPGRGGHKLSSDAAAAVYKAREKIAGFFGASGADRVIFTANYTSAINYVIKGFLNENDHVIISDLEHNAVVRPLKKTGVDFSVAAVDFSNDDNTVKNFNELINDRTKLIFCTAASNVFGRALPIERIGKLCKERKISFGVDAAQMAGVMPINMKKAGIDFLCIAPHKGLYAPMGLGILIAEKDIGETLIEGGTGTNSISPYQPDDLPERYESGTINLPAVMGASAGVDFATGIMKSAYKKETDMLEKLYNALNRMPGAVLYTPGFEKQLYVPVLSFNIIGKPSEQTAGYLNSKGVAVRAGLHCAPFAHKKTNTLDTGAVRVAPSYFNTSGEMGYLIGILKSYK